MKNRAIFGAFCLLLIPMVAQANPVLITGTPGDASTLPQTPASPNLGGVLINFDNLTACTTYPTCATFPTYTSQGVTISSPDGLAVIPYSTQSGPNELWDASADGSADLDITTLDGTHAIGVGIADSDEDALGDPVTIYLQALNASGVGFGSLFSVTIPENTNNPGNGYYVIEDSSPDIYGLAITQPVGNAALYSGLAIDDVQVAPEPSSFLLLATGLAGLSLFGLRKFGQA
jgi:hypothetical protein